MRPQAHVASGLLAWSASGAPVREAPLCALAANLPDLDRAVAKRLGVTRRDHHRWPSHSLAGWLPPTLLALHMGGRRGAVRRAAALVWVHLLLDSVYDGIAWLWPLRDDKLGLFRRPPEIHDDGWRTPAPLSSEPGRIEAALWAGAVAGLLLRSGRRARVRSARRQARTAG